MRIERAVRTGTGAFHVEARFSDGSRRHLAIRPFVGPPDDDPGAWPEAVRRAEVVVELDAPLPEGPPLRVDGTPADDDAEALTLEDGALRVLSPAGASWTLATFPTAREPTLAEAARDHHLRLAILGVTPLAAACDAVLVVVLVPWTLARD